MDRLLLTLLMGTVLPAVVVAPPPCPRLCSCPQPAELHCTFRSLTAIPTAYTHVERINLGFNSINKITDKSLAGLRKLELLMVHGNDIHSLPDGVFRDLTALQMLKISYNKLKEIHRYTLHGLWSLARLHLDHNHLESIHPDAFQGLTNLRLLQLEGNRLQQLHPATFSTFSLMGHFHLSTLRHLYLSDNQLTSLPSSLVESLPQLENLYLHGNPWTCDCYMRWLHDWNKSSPGILKCKKDKALPGGQLCPMCSSPSHLQRKELPAVEDLVCSGPVISFPDRTSTPDDTESEVMTKEDFKEPFGNISLELSDEHGNAVFLECGIVEPRELSKISWEQLNPQQLDTNITLSLDLECPVDREKYEQLWRLIAYYSSVPAHLQRGIMLRKEPHPTYVYKQDSEKDAQYYTGVKVNMMAQPAWVMQASADLQLNRLKSSAKTVKLILSSAFSHTVDVELVRRQRRTWVMIESTNTTRKVLSAILGSPSLMSCNVHSSGHPVIQWMLPDGSKVEAPHSSPDNRLSVSRDGQLVIKAVTHRDTGSYYCIAKVHGDLAILPFHLNVQESSHPAPGENALITPIEGFVGNPISLPCKASGSPDAEINWILPSNNIVCFRANTSRAFVYSNGTLHIPHTQLLDSGHYKCVAINQHGVDTLATKVTLNKRKGLIRPLRKFPSRPQSASGVNTQIKVPTEDPEEGSGDTDLTQAVMAPINRSDPVRRRFPGGVPPGRKGVHPARTMWRRPPLLGKQTIPRVDDRKNIVDSRRKINMSKSKIDPEKWADILAKIRDRHQTTVTPLRVQHTTESKLSQQTEKHSQETIEGSSEGQEDFTTAQTPIQHTQTKPNRLYTQGQGTRVTSDSFIAHNSPDMTSNRQHTHILHATAEPHATHTTFKEQHTTRDTYLDLHTTSNSVFFLPQTTSVPLHTVTSWQSSTNIASSSSATFSLQENQRTNTDVDVVKTTEWFNVSERSESTDGLNVVASSNNDRELSSRGNEIIPSVNPIESEASHEENGKYLSETATSQLHTQLAMLTTRSPTTTLPTSARRGSGRKNTNQRERESRRKNGGRRKNRPNRRNQKLNKPTKFTATNPTNVPVATVRTTAPTELKIETSEVTTANFNTTVPFSSGQATSSGRLSHDENTISGHIDDEVAARPSSQPTYFPEEKIDSLLPLAKPQFESTSVAPTFPTASPEEGHGNTSPQTDFSTSPPELLDKLTSTTNQRFMGSGGLPPVNPFEETQTVSITGDLGPVPDSDHSSEGFNTVTQVQTDLRKNQSDHQYTPTGKGGKMILKETDTMHFSLLPSQSTSTSGDMSSGVPTTHGLLIGTDLDTEQVATKTPTLSERSYHSSSQNENTMAESEAEVDKHLEGTANKGINVDAPIESTAIPSTVAPHVILPKTSSTGDEKVPSLRATSQEAPVINNIPDDQSQEQKFQPIITTSAPQRTLEFHPATQSYEQNLDISISENPTSPAQKLTHIIKQTATLTPTTAAIQKFGEGLTSMQDVSGRKPELPGQGSVPRGKPRITKSNFQTLTVKAETDAQLLCEAAGEPRPFLSWTKVASGVSIAQNSRVQRFEVHPNGTLIIRNTQPMDGGQYLCTVQNQYGTDELLVNLLILSQPPRVLEPRHRDITVHMGGKLLLDCKVEGHPTPRVTWVLPNHAQMPAAPLGVTPQMRVAILSNGTLQINQATYTDQGIYKCIGSSAAGADTVAVRLQVSAFPPVIQQIQQENTTLPEGSTAYIHCTAKGSPQPAIHWITPDGNQLTATQFGTSSNLFVYPNGTLRIQAFGPGNAGTYECSASNTVATRRRIVILSIRRNPSSAKARIISSSPLKTDVTYGGTLLLNCVARGEPEPRIIWKTPSKKLVDAQYSFDPRIKVFPNGTLTINSMTDKDSGDYLCVARNKMGDDYVLLGANVLTRPAKIRQKQQQSSQEVVYGGDLKVDCVASGDPNPEISWALPDGTMVNPVKQPRFSVGRGRSRRYVVFDNGTLYFNDVGKPEEGDYTCYAENQLGKDEMKVRVKVKDSTSPPKIQDKDQKTVKVFYGETVTLICNAKGEPMPVITWISPTNKLISPALDKYQVLDDGTLVVHKVQRFDGGNYTCMAKNNAGQDHKVTRLEVLVTSPVINGLRGAVNSVKVSAVPDQRKLIDCLAKGTPNPRIMWVLPGNVILPAPYHSNRISVHLNGTLEIRSAKRTDSGQLACIARNEGGEVRLVVYLDVKDVFAKPQTRDQTKTDSLLLTVGVTMTLNCSFEGSAPPYVTWILPNGTPLHRGARFDKYFHQTNSSLIISNPSVAEAGTYRCLGRNSQGLVERSITVSPGRKPMIINRYNSAVSVMNGERLLLHCVTSGEPLRLTWTLPSGVVLNRPQRAGRYAVLPNGTLDIQQVSVYDRGSYVCRPANEYGSSLLSVSVIVIAYPPRITNGPPSVTYAKHGVAVQLNCIATGTPKVEVAWETPDKMRMAVSGQPRLFGNKYLHPQGSLIIQNPTQRDAGVYRCTARNAIGVDSKATLLNVF